MNSVFAEDQDFPSEPVRDGDVPARQSQDLSNGAEEIRAVPFSYASAYLEDGRKPKTPFLAGGIPGILRDANACAVA
ncbi:MAG: hypothetical protein OXU64_01670 [Gemmatimonadota bacterium]|nr:hypothetical protein [Gemmatimonadota bacterium]